MKKIGIVSYNKYANFTNYGSAMQSWALWKAVNKIGGESLKAVEVDYCPDKLKHLDPLNPFNNMWDTDEAHRKACESALPAIRDNYAKFMDFYSNRIEFTKHKFTSDNFDEMVKEEKIDGFICGSDTIFCIDEFGIDDGYYANYDSMKQSFSMAYAASFGDSHFDDDSYKVLDDRLKNFDAVGLRENDMVDYVKKHTPAPVCKVIDPTLLHNKEDYYQITAERMIDEKYILLYSRRHNEEMIKYADELAEKNGWKVVDISLLPSKNPNHLMFYEAGVEEFLSLVRNAEFVVTNSFHGMIFAVQFEVPFYIFSREQCNTKITEILSLFGLSDRLVVSGDMARAADIDYSDVKKRIAAERENSLEFLKSSLNTFLSDLR